MACLYAREYDYTLVNLKLEAGIAVLTIEFHHSPAFSPCGRHFVTCHTGVRRLWKVPSKDVVNLQSIEADPGTGELLGCRGEEGQVVRGSTDAGTALNIPANSALSWMSRQEMRRIGPRTPAAEPTPLSESLPGSPNSALAALAFGLRCRRRYRY